MITSSLPDVCFSFPPVYSLLSNPPGFPLFMFFANSSAVFFVLCIILYTLNTNFPITKAMIEKKTRMKTRNPYIIYLFLLFEITDRITYQVMIIAKPQSRNTRSKGMQERIKTYLISLPFQFQCLNFRANIGISAIRR